MAGKPRVSDEQVIRVYNDTERYPSLADVRKELGYSAEREFRNKIKKLRDGLPEGTLIERSKIPMLGRKMVGERGDRGKGGRFFVATKPKVERWLLTSAQDDTAIDEPFWRNLHVYAERIGAEVLVGGFTYNKALFEDHASRTAVFAEAVRPYLIHENRHLGPLLFAAKMNTLPTAVRPLSGLETYSRGAWAVFPHAKIQLVSVPALPGRHPAMVMTTGACTVPNYIEKKAGLKAEFHHQIGATIVELDAEGRLFCRQIGADGDGNFQDLDAVVRNGEVTFGNRVEAITWGDIHTEKLDPQVAMAAWGFDVETESIVSTDSMAHALRPRVQAFHDLLDFQARNHHRRRDHLHAMRMVVRASERVEDETGLCARFLRATAFDWSTSVVVASNHNDALLRWLKETDPREDAINLRYWCELNAEWHRRIEAGDEDFDLFQWALAQHDRQALNDVVFVPRNGSFLVCQAHGGIELGLHGDEGPNGARGSAMSLNKVASRMNIGHSHSAAILDGVYQAGLCGLLDQGYNSGPSSWSHTQIVTYANSRRSLVTILDGKWRA